MPNVIKNSLVFSQLLSNLPHVTLSDIETNIPISKKLYEFILYETQLNDTDYFLLEDDLYTFGEFNNHLCIARIVDEFQSVYKEWIEAATLIYISLILGIHKLGLRN